MAIVLSRELELQIEEIVRTGGFTSAEEFIRHSVESYRDQSRWVEELARDERVQEQVAKGLRDLREGRCTQYDGDGLRQFAEQVKREGRIAMGLPADGR